MEPAVSRTGSYPYNPRYASVLEHDPITNEPFIALPEPHSNIRLTPPRLEDTEHVMKALNDPAISMNFAGPPFPFPQANCDRWIGLCINDYKKGLASISNADGEVGYLDVFPFNHIREVGPDGIGTFVGSLELRREGGFEEIKDAEARAAKANMNENLPPGDPDIVWSVGDYLLPSHHRRGIMTVAVKTLIERWARPHMNAHKFCAGAFPHNVASHKVFMRNGFKLTETLVGAVQFPESKGGLLLDSCCFSLELPVSEPVAA